MKNGNKNQQIEFRNNFKDLFYTIGEDSYFINSDCVVANDKVITLNKAYILFDHPATDAMKAFAVILKHVIVRDDIVHVILLNVVTDHLMGRKHVLDHGETQCSWVLVDPDYFKQKSDEETIEDYCENY